MSVSVLPVAGPGLADPRQRIAAALAALPEEERVVVQLCALPGRTYRTVARLTGDEPAVVLGKLRRGMARLRDELDRSAQEVAGDVLPQRY